MNIKPVTDNCRRVLELGDTAVIGISPFNSYFSESRITSLANWAQPRFRDVYYYLPDGPSAYTLEALGYAPAKAARKARRQSAWLRNKIKRALVSAGSGPEAAEDQLVDSARLDNDAAYQALLQSVHYRFETDIEFREACIACTGWVLQSRRHNPTVCNEAVNCAVQYLLAELPMFTHSCEITGTPSAVFCYHQCPDFIAGLFSGESGWAVPSHQGFVTVRPSAVLDASDLRSMVHESEQLAAAS